MKRLIFISLILIASITTNAQWNSDTDINTEVSTYTSDNMDMQSVGLSNGETAIVFWKEVNTGSNYELWLQVLDIDGNKTLGIEGQLISNSIPMLTFTNTWFLVSDKSNNIYVGVTGTDGAIGMAFKLDHQGNHLWPSSGVNLGSGYQLTILPLSDGNTIISWMDGSTYVSYIQKFDMNGSAIWTDNVLTDPTGYTVPANLFELSNGDIVSIYHQLGSGVNSTLWAQRFTANGDYVWTNPTQFSTTTTTYNYLYSPAQNGDTIYLGYIGKTGVRFDSFIQRLNPDGSLPWGVDGMDFDINQTNLEMDTRIAIEEGSNYLWAICTYTNSSQDQQGEYVQKINMTEGTRLLTDNAKELFSIGSENTHVGELFVYNDKPFFTLEKGYNNGVSEVYLDVLQLDENGNFDWAEISKPIASNTGTNKGQLVLTKKVGEQSVFVFVENKGTGTTAQIYAQNYVDQSTSIGSIEKNVPSQIRYNNPVRDNLNIQSENNINSVKIIDISGRVVYNKQQINNNNLNFNTSVWEKGIYILMVNSDQSFKIIKE